MAEKEALCASCMHCFTSQEYVNSERKATEIAEDKFKETIKGVLREVLKEELPGILKDLLEDEKIIIPSRAIR